MTTVAAAVSRALCDVVGGVDRARNCAPEKKQTHDPASDGSSTPKGSWFDGRGAPVGGILSSGGQGTKLKAQCMKNNGGTRPSFLCAAHSSWVCKRQNKLPLRQSLYLSLPVGLTKHLSAGTSIASGRVCMGVDLEDGLLMPILS
jgi:hypothetical protein